MWWGKRKVKVGPYWEDCICGNNEATTIPNGIDIEGDRTFTAMCRKCGELVMGFKHKSPKNKYYRRAWNAHMVQLKEDRNESK